MNFIDLFAGCGGMSLGFRRAGFNILGGVEYDETASRTNALNFFKRAKKKAQICHSAAKDITQLPPHKFLNELNDCNGPGTTVDVVIGGPPCQAFARIGRAKLREILEHPEAFLTDERASLYLHYLEYVDFFRPLAVVMENVPDIMNFGGKNIAEEIAISLDNLGYEAHYTILNSAHYGVPQMRQRFFLIAFLKELELIPEFPQPTHYIDLPKGYEGSLQVALTGLNLSLFDYDGHDGFRYVSPPSADPTLPPAITATDALGDLPPITLHLEGKLKRGQRKFDTLAPYRDDVAPSEYAALMRRWKGFASSDGVYDHVIRSLPRDYQIFQRMQPGDQYPEAYKVAERIFEEELARLSNGNVIHEGSIEYQELRSSIVPPYSPEKFPNKWRKMEADKPARTLTAHIGKDTYSHIHYDSSQARVISVREAARLQSFPDGFKFEGAMNAAFRQIGNAVPPLLANAVAKSIKAQLKTAVKRVPR